jgi:septal ring factor EnvC (AmiA/AmiB activator)
MSKIQLVNEWVKLVVAAALVFALVCAGVVLLHVNRTLTQADATIAAVTKEVAAVDTTRKTVDDLLVQTTVLVTDADDAATKETDTLDSVNKQVTATLANLNTTIVALTANQDAITDHVNATLDATTITIKDIAPVLASLNTTVKNANTTVKDADTVIKDQNIQKTLASVSSIAASSAETSQHVDTVTGDVAFEVNKLVHPDKKKLGFWGTTNAIVMYLNHFIPPIF